MDNKISLSEKIFSNPVYRFLLFLISYILAVVVTLLNVNILERDLNLGEYYSALFLFPIGLGMFFNFFWEKLFGYVLFLGGDEGFIFWSLIATGLSYIVITIYATVTKNVRITKILYFIFVSLLILNIYGCVADY